MKIWLDHTIVPAHDAWASARFLAEVLELEVVGEVGPFVQVRVNAQLALDFETSPTVSPLHLAFRTSGPEFERVVTGLKRRGIRSGSGPEQGWDGRPYETGVDRGIYFEDPSGHVYELITSARTK